MCINWYWILSWNEKLRSCVFSLKRASDRYETNQVKMYKKQEAECIIHKDLAWKWLFILQYIKSIHLHHCPYKIKLVKCFHFSRSYAVLWNTLINASKTVYCRKYNFSSADKQNLFMYFFKVWVSGFFQEGIKANPLSLKVLTLDFDMKPQLIRYLHFQVLAAYHYNQGEKILENTEQIY